MSVSMYIETPKASELTCFLSAIAIRSSEIYRLESKMGLPFGKVL